MNYYEKYLKYKEKYTNLKNQFGGRHSTYLYSDILDKLPTDEKKI